MVLVVLTTVLTYRLVATVIGVVGALIPPVVVLATVAPRQVCVVLLTVPEQVSARVCSVALNVGAAEWLTIRRSNAAQLLQAVMAVVRESNATPLAVSALALSVRRVIPTAPAFRARHLIPSLAVGSVERMNRPVME